MKNRPLNGCLSIFPSTTFCLSVCFFVRLRIFQRQKKVGAWNFACVLACYLDRSSPLLVKFGLRGVTGAALLSGMYATTDAILWDRMEDACGGLVGQSELRAAALLKAVWWGMRLAILLTHLRYIHCETSPQYGCQVLWWAWLCVSRLLTYLKNRTSIRPNFTKFYVPVKCGRGSVLWLQCNVLYFRFWGTEMAHVTLLRTLAPSP